jgi:hypothetical protein
VRQLARFVFLAGGVALGLYLFRASPRDVTLVYDFGRAPPRALEVEIVKDGRVVRRAELRQAAGASGQVEHRVRLTDGEYTVRLSWGCSEEPPGSMSAQPVGGAGGSRQRATCAEGAAGGGGPGRSLERRVTVEGSGTLVLPVERSRR